MIPDQVTSVFAHTEMGSTSQIFDNTLAFTMKKTGTLNISCIRCGYTKREVKDVTSYMPPAREWLEDAGFAIVTVSRHPDSNGVPPDALMCDGCTRDVLHLLNTADDELCK